MPERIKPIDWAQANRNAYSASAVFIASLFGNCWRTNPEFPKGHANHRIQLTGDCVARVAFPNVVLAQHSIEAAFADLFAAHPIDCGFWLGGKDLWWHDAPSTDTRYPSLLLANIGRETVAQIEYQPFSPIGGPYILDAKRAPNGWAEVEA